MLVFGRVVLPRNRTLPQWGLPACPEEGFSPLEGRSVVPGGFRHGVRWTQETGQVAKRESCS